MRFLGIPRNALLKYRAMTYLLGRTPHRLLLGLILCLAADLMGSYITQPVGPAAARRQS
jgi:hypothetical protein